MGGPLETLRVRLLEASLWWHRIAVGVGLLLLVPIVGTHASYSADEGVAIIQARRLADGDGWIVDHPLPEVDPDGSWYPLELSSRGPHGVAAFAKHPAYPLVLSLADRTGGHTAMVLLSLAGTWLAAIGASCLSGAILGGHRRTTLWLSAFGTPLLFNGYWVIAHSLAAAAVVWAALAAWQVAVRGRWRRAGMAVAPALMAAATLLRSEALLFGGAMALVFGLFGLWRRRWPSVALGPIVLAATYGAHRLDAWWQRDVLGGAVTSTGAFEPRDRSGAVADQVDGFVATWLRAAPAGSDVAVVVLVFGSALLVVASLVLLARGLVGAATLAAIGGSALLLARHLAEPASVPGLLMAFPLVVALGAGLRGRAGHPSDGVLLVAGVLVVSWAGVAATQYPEGAGAEWGGRYFALGLPLAVPLVVAGLARLLDPVDGRAAARLVLAWGVAAILLAGLSVRELARARDHTAALLGNVERVARSAGPSRVVVTDASPVPRLDWERFDQHSWLLVRPEDAKVVAERLAAAGEHRWVIVSADPQQFLAELPGASVLEQPQDGVVLVEHRRAGGTNTRS